MGRKPNTNDPEEIEVRINDHVVVSYDKEPHKTFDGVSYSQDYTYSIYVNVDIGDANLQYYIVGEYLTPLEDWILYDIYLRLGSVEEPLITEEWENIEGKLKDAGNESLRTWLKMAREKGGF